jgi:hypothetical protein
MTKLHMRFAVLAASAALVAGGATVATAPAAGAVVPACGNSSLAVTRAPSQGAAGHGAFDLLFRNVSHGTCTLYGYPGLDALDGHGHVLAHARRTLRGYMGGPGAVHTVSVAPGHFASATVEWLNFKPATAGHCTFSASVATTPANTTHTVHLPVSVSICALQVHPTVAGTTGNDAFARAQVAWIQGATASDAVQGLYWTRAENDLKAAGSAFTSQIIELKQLIAFPHTGLTPTQIVKVRSLTRALNGFFGTPGLYF